MTATAALCKHYRLSLPSLPSLPFTVTLNSRSGASPGSGNDDDSKTAGAGGNKIPEGELLLQVRIQTVPFTVSEAALHLPRSQRVQRVVVFPGFSVCLTVGGVGGLALPAVPW